MYSKQDIKIKFDMYDSEVNTLINYLFFKICLFYILRLPHDNHHLSFDIIDIYPDYGDFVFILSNILYICESTLKEKTLKDERYVCNIFLDDFRKK